MTFMARIKDGHLVPIEEAEAIQTEHERTRCVALLRATIEHLEMAGADDLAAEVRYIAARFWERTR